ncbi:hypothetical protein [Nocardioides terrisoli]|uniref:hypothetical protein n=1 Tax=Nocardioides terrisoli TaxID=3388267 RepID=UPI00287B7BD1|nr:hypothetical protein [Nocardioides marmorisolisilvae]
MAHEVLPPPQGGLADGFVLPVQQTRLTEEPAGPPVPVVRLGQLLRVAVLTPYQAVFLAAEIFGLLASRHAHNGRGPVPSAETLTVSGDGEVDWAAETTPASSSPEADLAAARGVAELLLGNTRSGMARRPAEAALLLRTLEGIAEEELFESATAAHRLRAALALQQGSGAADAERLRHELSALVRAFGRIDPPHRSPYPTQTAPGHLADPMVTLRAQPWRRRGWKGLRHRTRRRLLVTLAALMLVVAAAIVLGPGGQLARLRGDSAASTAVTPPSPTPSQPTVVPRRAAKTPRPLRTFAPASAGAVTGTTVKQLATCAPGMACPIQVTVLLQPAVAGEVVRWRIGIVNRCRGTARWVPATTMAPDPGWTRVFAPTSVSLPHAHSLALVAETTSPARTQSPPVLVPAGPAHCGRSR